MFRKSKKAFQLDKYIEQEKLKKLVETNRYYVEPVLTNITAQIDEIDMNASEFEGIDDDYIDPNNMAPIKGLDITASYIDELAPITSTAAFSSASLYFKHHYYEFDSNDW